MHDADTQRAPLLLPETAPTCQAFVLVERATTADDAVPVLVWIGADYEGVADPDDEEVFAARPNGACVCLLPRECSAQVQSCALGGTRLSFTVRDRDSAQECHNFATGAVTAFAKCEGITVEEVKVVLEGNEPDAFWDMFELG